MSPASSGNLEVEKYIGACLISQSRPKIHGNASRDVYFPRERYIPDVYPGNYVNFDGRFCIQRCSSVDRWAGGMPLISFANHQRRIRRLDHQTDLRSCSPKTEDQQNPLARLAVHTQGAPLILTKNFHNRRNKSQKNTLQSKQHENGPNKLKLSNKCNENKNNSAGVDTVSVTSDESSGSANSDNCLPRIIKPRKRRKKDRKPTHLGRPLVPDGFSTDSASPEIDTNSINNGAKSYAPFIFDPYSYRLVPDNLPFHKKPIHENFEIHGDMSEAPKLHHAFEDVEEVLDINGNQSTTVCQCRYCDPSGQIWDVDRSCYSPYLTAPNQGRRFQFPDLKVDSLLPSYGSSASTSTEHNCLIHSMSAISLEDEREQKNLDGKNISSVSRDLEVSTEIVTSLNGHRDIEIKFFSTSNVESAPVTARSSDLVLNVVDSNNFGSQFGENQADAFVNNECTLPTEE